MAAATANRLRVCPSLFCFRVVAFVFCILSSDRLFLFLTFLLLMLYSRVASPSSQPVKKTWNQPVQESVVHEPVNRTTPSNPTHHAYASFEIHSASLVLYFFILILSFFVLRTFVCYLFLFCCFFLA
jgi:hypothetical protein